MKKGKADKQWDHWWDITIVQVIARINKGIKLRESSKIWLNETSSARATLSSPGWVNYLLLCASYLFIYLFLERGREGDREGEKHQCVVASHAPPTGDLARNPGIFPDWESNLRPFGSQASTQPTEPHQPGLLCASLYSKYHVHLGNNYSSTRSISPRGCEPLQRKRPLTHCRVPSMVGTQKLHDRCWVEGWMATKRGPEDG